MFKLRTNRRSGESYANHLELLTKQYKPVFYIDEVYIDQLSSSLIDNMVLQLHPIILNFPLNFLGNDINTYIVKKHLGQ